MNKSTTTENDFEQKVAAHQLRNETLTSTLKARGVELTLPRPIELHFWAADHRAAAVLAKALYDKGYLVLALGPAATPEPGKEWNVEAGTSLAIDKVTDSTFTRELVELAIRHSAEYDGWGTSV